MEKQIHIPLPKNINFSVFEALKLHGQYFEGLNMKVTYLSRNEEISGENIINHKTFFHTLLFLHKCPGIIYCITVNEVLLAWISNLLGSKKEIIFWVQGLVDDEDYLTRNNIFRHFVYKKLLELSLKISSKIVVVTDYMFEVLKKTYKCPKTKDYIVIPCHSRVSYNGEKKIANSLCYIGGLSKWQNVDIILQFYNNLSQINDNYKLFIATFDHDKLKRLIKTNVSENYQGNIRLLSLSSAIEVELFLSKMEFGFLIRDNIPLNNVASPIKLAEYLSCGVTPIISASLTEFYNKLKRQGCGVFVSNDFSSAINQLTSYSVSAEKTMNCYQVIYEPDDFEIDLKRFLEK